MATVIDVAKYFIYRSNQENSSLDDEEFDYDPITNMKLQKLVYYAQGACLAILDKPLFNETLEAWKYGPVSSKLYQHYKSYKNNPINEQIDIQYLNKSFSPTEINVLNLVYNKFSIYTAFKLKDMSHQDAAWKDNFHSDVLFGDIMPIDAIKQSVKLRLMDEFKLDIEITLEDDEVYVVDVINARGAIVCDKSKEKALREAKEMAFQIIAGQIRHNEYK